MIDFLKRFWAVAVSSAALVGLYITADALDLLWAFLVTVVAALGVSAGWSAGPRVLDLLVKARKYPALLSEVARLTDELEETSASAERYRNEAERAWGGGVREGRAQAIGVVLAANIEPPPVVAITDLNGKIALVGDDAQSAVPIGARFVVEVRQTGDRRGVVEARQHDSDRGVVYLDCVTPTVSEFWTRLADRVAYDSSPPNEVKLVPFTANHFPSKEVRREPIMAPQLSPEDEL